MKQRSCDLCGKKKRYDADKFLKEGWTLQEGKKLCPWCSRPAQLQDEQHPPDPLGPDSSWVWVEYLCGDKIWMGCIKGREVETKAFVLKILCERHQLKDTPVELVITRAKK